jgi:hypothetical protein
MFLHGEPLILPRDHVAKVVTFHGDGFAEAVGQSFVEYAVGDLDPATEREQTAYERGLSAKRRLGFEEVQRKGWSPDELSAYQQGLKDRASQ